MFVRLSTISSQELDHCNEEIKDLEKKKEAPASPRMTEPIQLGEAGIQQMDVFSNMGDPKTIGFNNKMETSK